MLLHFALMSGQEVAVEALPEDIVDDVLNRAQDALNVVLVSMISSSGALLNLTRSLEDEGVQDGDRLIVVVDKSDPPQAVAQQQLYLGSPEKGWTAGSLGR
ncbi:unnamed protein product [Durusdinium trenchii]|uniref:Ubiquitin-like domain-containing protein n=1 Tax=Durusdinium trenchii TaxID=1381693 RepID=A0ABP0LHD4_9DINO